MAFCRNCGIQMKEESKFCSECGASVEQIDWDSKSRENVFDGEIHKCPNCGERLNSFEMICISCGYELRGKKATYSVQLFYNELCRAIDLKKKDSMIRNFPIPNTKEDVLEFLILASSNVIGEDDKDIFDAWIAKFEQVYKKAQLLFKNEKDVKKIQELHDEFYINVYNEKTKKNIRYTLDILIRNIAVCSGIIAVFIAVLVDNSGGNASMIELIGYIVLIGSAFTLAKREASMLDFGVGALSGIITIGFSFLLKNGSMGELCGGIILTIIAVNFFRSVGAKKE